MEAMIDRRAVSELTRSFAVLSKHVPLHPIRTEAEYDAAVAALHGLMDAGAADEKHPLADLAATLGELVGDYDDAHYPAGKASSSELLNLFMEQHGLKQSELPEVGSQGVVSEVLRGKRELNLRQMRALATRFSVPVSLFVDARAP